MNANDITFGIELETTIPVNLCPVGAYHVGAAVPFLPAGWTAQRDGSILATEAGTMGCEFVSPVLKGIDGLNQVLEVVRILTERGAKVNASCGFHVHVGFTNEAKSVSKLVTLVANFEKALYAITGTKAREQGRWCKGLQTYGTADAASRSSSSDRYHMLNLTNLITGRRPAVEFRAFAGTLNAKKIAGTIRLCIGLVERALEMSRATNFTAKAPTETSPIARDGEGETALNRLFYQLGWTKGRAKKVYGDVPTGPDLKELKAELMRMAKKYDAR